MPVVRGWLTAYREGERVKKKTLCFEVRARNRKIVSVNVVVFFGGGSDNARLSNTLWFWFTGAVVT